MDELNKKIEELGRAFEEFKKANDARIAEIQKSGTASALTIEKVEKANEAIDRLSRERDTLQKEIDGIKTAMARPAADPAAVAAQQSKESKAAFSKYLRKGERSLSVEETKAMSVDSDPDGGYVVTPEMSTRVVSKIFESSPIRQLASVQTISTDALEMLADLDEADCGWVGERQARNETNTPQLKGLRIPVHEIYAMPKATQKLLDDASLDIEAWLAGKVAEKFERTENTAFVSGDGQLKPRGFLTYPHGTSFGQIEQVNSGHATLLTADGLMNVFYALKADYARNATWLMKRASVKAVRQLKDGTGNYLWAPGLAGGEAATILNRPYMEADDMPTIGAGTLSVAFADWREAYQVVDRIGIRVLRDPYTAKPHVLFYTTKRVGGDVVNFEAIKIQKVAA